MNILYTLNSGNPGGMEQHVLDLVRGMIGAGHNVFVWCAPGSFAEEYRKAGAKVSEESIKLDICPQYILKLAHFMSQNQIDLVHSHELKAVVNSLLAAVFAGVKIRVTHTHTPISEWQVPSWKKELNMRIYSFLVNRLSTVEIALTESRQRVKESEGISPDKLAIIPNGVNFVSTALADSEVRAYRKEICERYGISENAYIFGFISRISREKGHEVLIHAYKQFKDFLAAKGAEDNSFLFLGGGGDLEPETKQLIKDLDLDDTAVITGRFASEDHQKFYATLDCFVFPSLAEGFGIVLLEAMAHLLPVICSDLEVLQEVGGATVRYFEAGNPNDLAEKMVDLYGRRDQFKELTQSAFQRVHDLYSFESFTEKYLNLYSRLLQNE